MYVTKRGDKFRAWERIVVNGEVKKISVTMDRDTPQARKKAAAALAKKMERPVSELTYPDLVDLYIQFQKATVKMSTWKRNEASLKRLEEVFGKVRIDKLTAGFITSALLKKTDNPGTFNEYLKRVKAMIRWAYRNDYTSSSACVDKIQPLKEDKTAQQKVADKFLEADELKQILDAATEYDSMIYEFLALSGLRIGELIALENDDITDSDIIVRKTFDSNHKVVNTPKTDAGWRYVHIQPELMACIKKIRKMSAQNCLVSRQRPPYFIVNVWGGRLSYTNLESAYKSLCARVLQRELTLHSLRHTHVALMAEAGASLQAISRRIGHRDTKITKEIYYHVTRRQKAKDDATFDAISILA